MNFLHPIYTEKRECQDCYKCVRTCPVKAIRVEAGCATVMPEHCIYCGHCVQVCPNGAKKVRDDLPRARQVLASHRLTFVSLAPSFVSDFPHVSPLQMVAALRRLGFAGVSETALGAQQVSAASAALLRDEPRLLLSSACPAVVAYLQKHRPQEASHVAGLLSPLLSHCRLLRQQYGDDIGIVFVGPCIAKKLEADDRPDLLDVALTFEELRRWLAEEGIVESSLLPTAEDHFVPEKASDGAWYPVDGGMIAGLKAECSVHDAAYMSFSGLGAIDRALTGLDELPAAKPVFIELLACEGGCVNGPRASRSSATAAKRYRVLQFGRYPDEVVPRPTSIPIACATPPFPATAPAVEEASETRVREALRLVGKFCKDDELNCGGCGYDSCREFARALLSQKAERAMCVTYMRKLAQKKANALIQKMPSAVVIVNESLRILECNRAFVRLFGQHVPDTHEALSALEDSPVSQWVPFHALFSSVLKTGLDIVDKDLRHGDLILHLSIFTIEKHCVVGAIIQDVTRPVVQKEQVIQKAQEVIGRNLETVQKIAYLLGENAAESEIMLSQIIDSFTPPRVLEDPVDPAPLPSASGAPGGVQDWRRLYKR